MERIRASGGRVTQSRRMVVARIVEGGDHHVTAPDLIDAMRDVDPDFHESTVYRVLERLTELEVVEQVNVRSGVTIFHLVQDHHHHHLVCTDCGSVTETDGELLDEAAAHAERHYGFSVKVDSPATLFGRCATCRDASD